MNRWSKPHNKWLVTVMMSLFLLALGSALPVAAASPPVPPRAASPGAAAAASPYAGAVLVACDSITGINTNCPAALTGPIFNEAQAAKSLGYPVQVLTDAQWISLSQSDFASARAIIIGDYGCTPATRNIGLLINSASVWGPAITGNVILAGNNPVFQFARDGNANAKQFMLDAITLATSTPGFTGAYINLNCLPTADRNATDAQLLNAALDPSSHRFSLTRAIGDKVTVVGSNSFLSDETSSALSCWNFSAHEGFGSFPPNFTVFANVLAPSACRNQGDAQVSRQTSVPYILLRTPLAVGTFTPPPGWITGDVRDSRTHAVVPGGTLSLTDTKIPAYFSFNGGFIFSALSISSGYGGSSTYGVHLSPPPGYSVVGPATQMVSVVSGHFVWTTFYVSWNPKWVQVLTPNAPLWSGTNSNATQLGTMTQWSYLEIIEPMSGSRLCVYNPGTKGIAYIERADVGPSGAPPSQ